MDLWKYNQKAQESDARDDAICNKAGLKEMPLLIY